MKRTSVLSLLVIVALAAATHTILVAQGQVGQNINIVSGSGDQFIGDMFRQRQNEPALGISSVNPSHMMAAYNDYRTVDFAGDPGVGTPSPGQGAIAKLFKFFKAPWKREREREREGEEAGDSAQAWIGLSFTDDGKTWYTGLHPGHAAPAPPVVGTELWDQSAQLNGYEAMSDPVMATTPDQFFVGGIAFTPNGQSVGFVSRFTDRNNTAAGQNIVFNGTKLLLTQPAGFFVDKPSIAAGPNGHVYAAFVVFDQSDPTKLSSKIMFFQSANSGDTWSSGQVVSTPLTRNQSPWIVVDPNNENVVYIGWRLFAAPQLPNLTNAVVGRKSTNGGQSFTPSLPYPVALLLKPFDAPQVPLTSTTLQIPRSNAYPTAAIDGSGGIHVAMQEYVYPPTYSLSTLRGLPLAPWTSTLNGVPRITVTSSYDGGATWTIRKAIDFGAGSGTQFMPVMTAVGEPGASCSGQTGPRSKIMVMYYDARAGGVGTAPGTNGGIAGGDKQFDVRIAQASACNRDGLGRPIFSPSERLSRYTLSATPPHGVVMTPTPPSVPPTTAVNRAYSMFCGGNCAFTGDYIHLSPRVPYVQTETGWKLTTANGVDTNKLPAPVVQGVWADTRDVVMPTFGALRTLVPASASAIDQLPWDVYQPPGTSQVPCINPGARDQNIYTAEYAPGQLFAAAPDTFRPSNIPHAYPLYVENRAGEQRFFRLTIDPAAPRASFDYRSFDALTPAPLKQVADVVIGPYSTVTGSVVVAALVSAPVTVTIVQLDSTTDSLGNVVSTGTVLANGARTSVTLQTAGEAAAVTETHAPVVAPMPVKSKPFAGTAFPITVTVPFTQTPFTQTTYAQNPFTQTPFTQTATLYDVTDYTFKVTSAGSDAAAFATLLSVQNALKLQASRSYLFQVLISRISSTTALNGCQAIDRPIDVQVSQIVAPFTQTPFTQTPFTQTPFTQTPFTQTPFTQTPFTQTPFTQTNNPSDPTISNSTFYLAPTPTGNATPSFRAARPIDEVDYTLRAFQIRPSIGDSEFVPLEAPNGQPQVGVTVVSDTPEVIVLPGGGSGFNPAGPPVSSGGAAVPVKLAFALQPTSTAPGQALGGEGGISVAIQDGFGNTIPGATAQVTIALGSNPGNATLSGTLTRAAVNGIATFSNLAINNIGSGYTLVATAANLTSATSTPFDIRSDILIYGPSLSATSPNEQTVAAAAGYTVTVKDATWWLDPARTPADFAAYRAIVFPDPHCESPEVSPLLIADTTKGKWAPAVTGAMVVVGTDPVFHAFRTAPQTLMLNSINFAASGATTGMYMPLSCYYRGAAAGTTVPVLSPFGTFTVQGLNRDTVHVIDTAHPVMSGLNDANLSNWSNSVHEVFTSYPAGWTAVAAETTGGSRTYIIAKSAPVSWWQGEGNALDAQGVNPGTLTGDWVGGFVSGHGAGQAFSFDGIRRHVEVPASATLEPSHVTAMAWVRHLGSPGPGAYVLSKGAQGCTAASYAIYSGSSGGLSFYFFSDGTTIWSSPQKDTSIWDGNWHLAAGTYDGAMVRLYVDGVEVGTGNPTTFPIKYDLDSRKFLIGAYGHGAGLCNIGLTADVDDVRIYNRALTANEISAIFSTVP